LKTITLLAVTGPGSGFQLLNKHKVKFDKKLGEKVLSSIVLIASMTFFSIIFEDWENFKAGWNGTAVINTPIDYHDIFTSSLIISLPLLFVFFASEEKKLKA
jgi:hypothetical protein